MNQVISMDEAKKWDQLLEGQAVIDAHALHGYCIICKNNGDGEPFLFHYYDQEGDCILYPFIRREIHLPFLDSFDKLYDIITPYGFGGPLIQSTSENAMIYFREEFHQYCVQENIISEFIRFNPMLENHLHWQGDLEVIYSRKSVFVDLTRSQDEILQCFHKNHLRNLKRAETVELEFRAFEGSHALCMAEEFYELYQATMKKLNAQPYYYFSLAYVKELLQRLDDNSLIGAVFYQNQMISGALCMYAGKHMHYHLGCSNHEFLSLGTNVFQFYQIALWGKEKGLSSFHLGPGHADGDSLFQFKHRFNQGGTKGFYVGKKVHHVELYHSLVEQWEDYYSQKCSGDFFPQYRAVPKDENARILSNN